MEIACNVISQAPLIAELVNLATTSWRGGTQAEPTRGDALAEVFADQFGSGRGKALRTAADAGERLGELADELRAAVLAELPADKAALINAMIRRYGAQPYLVEDAGQPFHLHFDGSDRGPVESLGGEFAAALALIVDGYGVDRFGQCEASRCDAVYLDLTRNGSRRFCSPACTARAKTAAYRARRGAEPAS